MTTLRVVPAFDEVEHGDLGLGARLEASSIDQFALERGKETPGHGGRQGLCKENYSFRGPRDCRGTLVPYPGDWVTRSARFLVDNTREDNRSRSAATLAMACSICPSTNFH